MTDDLTREHERALLACAFLGGAHVGSHTKSLESSQHLALICAKHGACRPRSTHTPGLLRPAVDFARAPEPAPALWRDPSSYVAHDPGALRRGVVDRRSSPSYRPPAVSARAPPPWKIASAAAAVWRRLRPARRSWPCRRGHLRGCTDSHRRPSCVGAADSEADRAFLRWPDPDPLWSADLDTRGASFCLIVIQRMILNGPC